jgi:hypothetical protein
MKPALQATGARDGGATSGLLPEGLAFLHATWEGGRDARATGNTPASSRRYKRREIAMGEQHHHHEHQDFSAHSAPAVLDIGEDIGALVIYTRPELHGQEIEVSPTGNDSQRTLTAVLERRVNGRSIYAALYLALPAGDYTIWWDDPALPRTVTITGGTVAELDWR